MLDYDYLARPVKLVPRTLEAMPTVEDGGRTYAAGCAKASYFTPDPAFKGRRRELTAADHAYGIERILDPAVKSPWLWMFEGKIVGGDEARARALKTGHFDYDAPIAGLEVVDRYTLRIRLTSPDLRFAYALAVPNVAAQAREVVEAYGNDIGAHPVGTGPYMLGAYQRSTKIELVANPGFRETYYTPAGPIPAGIAAGRRGAQGQAPAAGRPHRDQHHRGGPGALARLSQGRDRHPRQRSRRFHRPGARRRQVEARARRARHRPQCPDPAEHLLDVFQHEGSRWSAATRPTGSRCVARSRWVTTSAR